MFQFGMMQKKPGQLIARGTSRLLRSHNFATLTEFSPTKGLRVDIVAIGPKSEIWIIECKSSREDFMSDQKWSGYLEWADRYFWAVDQDFPTDLLPLENGLIVADRFDGEILRMPEPNKLSAARRKHILTKFGRNTANRLQAFTDPGFIIP